MLPLLLCFASVQLVAAFGCFLLARTLLLPSLFGGTAFFLVLPALMSSYLFLQFLMLLLIAVVCLSRRTRAVTFLAAGTGVSLAAIMVLGSVGTNHWSTLRERYPVESLVSRLAYETNSQVHPDPSGELAPAVALSPDELIKLDDLYEQSLDGWNSRGRNAALRLVHASQVEQFAASEGFGVGRGMGPAIWMIEMPAERPLIAMPSRQQPSTSQESASASSEQVMPRRLPEAEVPELDRLHSGALVDFVNAGGFGYIQDRDHVVGFDSHRFSHLPEPCGRQWTTARVELVSLLKHSHPMVYVSDHLPSMDELRDAPVRPLDAFEQRALTALRAGHEIESDATDDRIRMLGAVRAASQCMACHAVEHGTLLGAFSYELRPLPPGRPPSDPPSGTSTSLAPPRVRSIR